MRLVLVVAVVVALLAARQVYAGWRRRVGSDDAPVPRLPADLVAGAERTWVVFTMPYCAACEPLVERLRDRGRVVTVDATERPALARAMRVRSAPTAFLADGDGNALTRLVGADLTRVSST